MNSTQCPKPMAGISSCLLANRFRHSAVHKADTYIMEERDRQSTRIPLYPEVQVKPRVLRKALRLVGSTKKLRLLTGNHPQNPLCVGASRTSRLRNNGSSPNRTLCTVAFISNRVLNRLCMENLSAFFNTKADLTETTHRTCHEITSIHCDSESDRLKK